LIRDHFVRAGTLRWRVRRTGSGPPALFVHGTGSSSVSFDKLATELAERYEVLAPDLPDHDQSIAGPGFSPSIRGTAAALRELLDVLGAEPALLVGHSAGVAVLVEMMRAAPSDRATLVAIAPALVPFRGVAGAVMPTAAALLARSRVAARAIAFHAQYTQSVPQLVASMGSKLAASDLVHYQRLASRPSHVRASLTMMSRWDLAPVLRALADIEAPILVIAGADDTAVPLWQAQVVAARARHAKLVVRQRCGHLVHEEDAPFVARAILAETKTTESFPEGSS